MKKLILLLAIICVIGIDAKADYTFTNNTTCDLTIEIFCRDCFNGATTLVWGPHLVAAGGSINVPGLANCPNQEKRVARICYAACDSCVQWVNFDPGGFIPENCDIIESTFMPGGCPGCLQNVNLSWTSSTQFVAAP